MKCPEKWEAVSHGVQNLQDLLFREPAVVQFHQMLAVEVRRIGFEQGTRLIYSLERKDRARTTHTLTSLVLGKNGLSEVGIGPAAWGVMRLQCATDFLGQMFPPLCKASPVMEMDWTPETTMVWLLTELWERRFDSWLKLVALEYVGQFPFYGIEAVPQWL